MALVDSFSSIIFDYGGVLVHHQTDADQAHLARIAGLDKDLFSELYWSDRADYDRGTVTGIEYWQHLAIRAGMAFSSTTIDALTEYDNVAWMHFDEPMFAWMEQLKKAGKRVGVLSNMPKDLGEAIKTRTRKFELFDHVTLSYEVGSVKPEPAIYEDCLIGLRVKAQDALFLDDRIENVHGAERIGLHAVQFTSRQEVLPALNGAPA